jgi:hypothetical protein
MQKVDGYRKMVGALPSSRKDHEEAIRVWMDTIVRDGGIDRCDDLHVDQIDACWKAPRFWVSAALESFELAVGIRDAGKSNFSVVLAFSLESDELPKGINFHRVDELEENFNATPPSLYLFRPGTEFWARVSGELTAEDIVEEVDARSIFGSNPFIEKCIYMELRQPKYNEYTRKLFVAGTNTVT